MPSAAVAKLTKQLQVDIDPELLQRALTHRSYAYEHGGLPHNERLEFVGDAVLGHVVAVHLYREYPDIDEGGLAQRRAAVVSTVALADIARSINLGEYLLLGRGEELTGGRDKDKLLADTMEAIFGAVCLSVSADAAKDLILGLIKPALADVERLGAIVDPKTTVQEYAARAGLGAPDYQIVAEGPDHARSFTATVRVGDVVADGVGTSKKAAEIAAALAAWQIINADA